MANFKQVVILGVGEIGVSVRNALELFFTTRLLGRTQEHDGSLVDLLIIAFPFSDTFASEVRRYQELFKPTYTLVVSTVPPGTCRALGVAHSPVTGKHPFLAESIKTFTRFISGPANGEIAEFFRRAGIRTQLFDKQEATELGKVSQTTIYAVLIEYIKDLKKRCDELDLSFSEVYTLMSRDYNEGYAKLGYPEFVLPLLQPIMTQQGGHCTRRNCDLWETPFTKLIKELNDSCEKNSLAK